MSELNTETMVPNTIPSNDEMFRTPAWKWSQEDIDRACHPGGHYCDYYPGALSLSEVTATHLKIGHPTRCPLFKWVAEAKWEGTCLVVTVMATRATCQIICDVKNRDIIEGIWIDQIWPDLRNFEKLSKLTVCYWLLLIKWTDYLSGTMFMFGEIDLQYKSLNGRFSVLIFNTIMGLSCMPQICGIAY